MCLYKYFCFLQSEEEDWICMRTKMYMRVYCFFKKNVKLCIILCRNFFIIIIVKHDSKNLLTGGWDFYTHHPNDLSQYHFLKSCECLQHRGTVFFDINNLFWWFSAHFECENFRARYSCSCKLFFCCDLTVVLGLGVDFSKELFCLTDAGSLELILHGKQRKRSVFVCNHGI